MNPTATAAGTRDRILDAADHLLGRLGYRRMTLDDLARESGVGRRTIYLWFTGKEEIALASIDRVVDRLCVRLTGIADRPESAGARLRAMLLERVLFRVDSVRGYVHSLDDLFAELRPAYMERRERYFRAEAEIFTRVLREGRRRGEIVRGAEPEIARSLLLATNSLLPYSLRPSELGARTRIERAAGRLADLLLGGLQRRLAETIPHPQVSNPEVNR